MYEKVKLIKEKRIEEINEQDKTLLINFYSNNY